MAELGAKHLFWHLPLAQQESRHEKKKSELEKRRNVTVLPAHSSQIHSDKMHGRCVCVFSEELVDDWVEERHVLGTLDGQLVDRVVVDHFGDALKGLAELAQYKLSVFTVHNLHVHEPSCALQGE